MNLNHLMYFRVLARTQHYGKAAQELYISQPSLSYAISTLEQALGTQLFEKKGRNVCLTKYGEFFAESVEKTFSELEYAEEKLRKLTGSHGGHIDLSYYHTLGIHFIPGIIKAFLKGRHSREISFSLCQQNSQETVKSLIEGRIDIGFCTHVDPQKLSELEAIPVKKDYFYIIVPTGHPLAACEKVSLTQLNEYPFVAFSRQSGLRPVIDEILNTWKITPDIAFETEQGSAVAGIVAAGLGISLLPDIPLPDMDITRIPLEEPVAPRVTYLVRSRIHFQTEILQQFQQFVLNYCHALN